MATDFLLGGFGGGKSYAALKLIYSELTESDRPVVTNLSVIPKKLNDLIQKRFPDKNIRVLERLRLLSEDEVPYFFCHRVAQPGLYQYDIPVPSEDEQKRGKRPDFSLWRDRGHLFVIDEFHDYFNNRSWADIGRAVGWYKNQQRKLTDDIVAVTPNIDEVEKQIRQTGNLYTVMTNMAQKKVKGIAMPAVFVASEYSSLRAVKAGSMPHRTYLTLDKELAECYDTARGVRGIQGKLADKGKKQKGLKWYWALAALFMFAVCLFCFIRFGGQYLFHRGFSNLQSASSHSSAPVTTNHVERIQEKHRRVANDAGRSEPTRDAELSEPVFLADTPDDTNDVVCVGYVVLGDDVTAYFSDGSSAFSDSGEVQKIEKHWVTAFGRRYRIIVGQAVSPALQSGEHFTSRSRNENETYQPQASYSQGQVSEAPAENDAEILPAIHSQAASIPPTPRVNGFSTVASHFQTQTSGNGYQTSN